MPSLNPTLTSDLANNVYALSKISNRKEAVKFLNDKHSNMFGFTEKNTVTAKTGPIGIKISSAFGFVLAGKEKFGLKGHAVILFRGTVSAADWLTNLNITTSTTESGLSVHDGFNQAFNSMKPQITQLLSTLKNVHTFHCIGHSLGGALATLCASWLKGQ